MTPAEKGMKELISILQKEQRKRRLGVLENYLIEMDRETLDKLLMHPFNKDKYLLEGMGKCQIFDTLEEARKELRKEFCEVSEIDLDNYDKNINFCYSSDLAWFGKYHWIIIEL